MKNFFHVLAFNVFKKKSYIVVVFESLSKEKGWAVFSTRNNFFDANEAKKNIDKKHYDNVTFLNVSSLSKDELSDFREKNKNTEL